jgi:predicted ThiF/HesA family dinucleotide-utilizing enzyme
MGGTAAAVITVAREDGRVLGSAVAVWFVSEKQGRVCVSEDDEGPVCLEHLQPNPLLGPLL